MNDLVQWVSTVQVSSVAQTSDKQLVPVHINLSFKFPPSPTKSDTCADIEEVPRDVLPTIDITRGGDHTYSDSTSSTSSGESNPDSTLDSSSVSSIDST